MDEGGDDGDANTNCEHVLTIRGRDGGCAGGRRDRRRGERIVAEERKERNRWRGREK